MEKFYLQSQRLRLRPFESQDVEALKILFAQADRIKLYLPGTYRFYNSQQLQLLLEDWNDAQSSYIYCIERLEDGAFLGVLNVDDVSHVAKHFDLGIILADLAFEGKGYAREAVLLLLTYMFEQYGMQRAGVKVISSNESSKKLFLKLGFQSEGCWRSYVFRDGQYMDLLHFSLLKEEFFKQKSSIN